MESKKALGDNLEGQEMTCRDSDNFTTKLDRLAEVVVRVGLGLQRGQELLVMAPLEAHPLVRKITKHAYRAGAPVVSSLFSDEKATLMRFHYASEESFDYAPIWLHEAVATAFRSGTALVTIGGATPGLLDRVDPNRLARVNRAISKASRPALDLIRQYKTNHTAVVGATKAWAATVFPSDPPTLAIRQLWNAIFTASRISAHDCIAAWHEHSSNLQHRASFLSARHFSLLHFRGPGTNLRVGLAKGHIWIGGAGTAASGVPCVSNIPTEEVFTMPQREEVEGTVTSTRPLCYHGTLIEGISARFENGRMVHFSAKRGEVALRRMLDIDEGSRYLGEVALVPNSSPIAKSGFLFWNTLLDENAASHIALGQAYSACIRGGDSMDASQLAERGANQSLIHVDCMIGSAELDVDGITTEGRSHALMRKGEWCDLLP